MAKAKIGGAFGMLRGSIGSVTYSVKKNTSGKTEQIARQKATTIANPNTIGQILQRMKLGPAQRFYDAFEYVVGKGILSHSFEHITYGNPSREYFLSQAMKKKDAVYIPKGVDFFVPGEYLVSEGSLSKWSYFNQLTAEEAAQNELVHNFGSGDALTDANIEAFVNEGYEQGMQLTIIGAREIAGGRYEPFASRVIMLEGNKSDNLVGVELYDHGVFVVTDPKIAAIAVIVSKGSQQGNDYRSTATMKFVNGYDSLKSAEALQAAVDSYLNNTQINNLNSSWYLNQDNGQSFNGRVEMVFDWLKRVGTDLNTRMNVLCGLQADGDTLNYVVFTSDGTENGQVYGYGEGENDIVLLGEIGDVLPTGKDFKVSPKIGYAVLTPTIAAQGGFTLGEE